MLHFERNSMSTQLDGICITEQKAFTMAEVLITLGIIGVVAAMTLPALIANHRERENVAKLEKFISTLSQAINQYKADSECIDNISNCLEGIGQDSSCKTFDYIAAKMHITDSANRNTRTTKPWLPEKSYNYYGDEISGRYGGPSKITIGDCAYLLPDGTTFSMDANPQSFNIMVDVNGSKLPNRVGRDIFPLFVGGWRWSDRGQRQPNDIILYHSIDVEGSTTYNGLCAMQSNCDPDNLDPKKSNGASVTAYTVLHKKLPPVYKK